MDNTIKLFDLTFEVMIPAEQIKSAVERVAKEINRDYKGSHTPIIIGVLNGSFMFLSDLSKELDFNCEIAFVKLASYSGTESNGNVKELLGLKSSIHGRDVIIVEDIVDSGNSIEHILNTLSDKGAKSIRVCTLFFKPNAYQKDIVIDYKALEIGNEFIVGYGLDYNELGRTLKDIYVVQNG